MRVSSQLLFYFTQQCLYASNLLLVGLGQFRCQVGQGKVYGNDIEPRMLTLLRDNMKQRKITNVEPVLGGVDDPRLPENSLDLVLMVDVYHEFSEPQKMLRRVRAG